MDVKIQELTEKIYNEGVAKGNAEAERIIADAKARAAEVEREARAEASAIVKAAERQVETLKANTESELRLYANQLVESTRASIVECLSGEIAEGNVQAATVDPTFMQRVILELVKGFDPNKGVEISTAQAKDLETYFASNAKDLLEKGVLIKSVSGKPTQFTLRPADGSFKIQISEEEFLELFKSFIRPQLAQQLF